MRTNLKHADRHDVNIEVTERRDEPGVFAVEIIDYEDEGNVYVTNFYGPRSKERADAYARWQRGQ